MLEQLMQGYQWGSRFLFAEPPSSPLGVAGNMLSRAIGSSLEFMDHREYMPGDDLRRIDWNAYARTDRLNVKLYREEVNPHVDLLLDASKSMALTGTKKRDAALAIAGFFASVAAESHFSFSLHLTEDGCRKLERTNLLPTEWEPFEIAAVSSPAEAFGRMPPAWRARGIRVIVSDLLFLADPNLFVAQIAQDAAVTIVVQLLAQEDAEPPEAGNLRLVDTESGELLEVYLDTIARARYMQNLARHQENYLMACRRHGATMTTLIAEKFLEEPRMDDLLSAELLRIR